MLRPSCRRGLLRRASRAHVPESARPAWLRSRSSRSRSRGRGRSRRMSRHASRTIPAIPSSTSGCSGGMRTPSRSPTAWWSPPILLSDAGALALSEHLAGFAIVTTPLQWIGASALTATTSPSSCRSRCPASSPSSWCGGCSPPPIARRSRATSRRSAAGLAYGFGPYRAGQLAHLQVLTSQWMPLALLAMHAYVEDGRRRWLALFAAAWLVQALSNGYYLLFFPVLIAAWLLWSWSAS